MQNRGQVNIHGDITLREVDNTPPVPQDAQAARLYVKGDNLVIQWNQGGTAYYKYIDLSGTVGTWTHGTAAP